jgi:hypothetical protein
MLSCGVYIGEIRKIDIQILMVEYLNNMFPKQITQVFQVNNVSGFRIYWAGHFDHQFIIMTMVIGIAAFPEMGGILFLIPCRVEQPMRGVEMFFSINCNVLCHENKL